MNQVALVAICSVALVAPINLEAQDIASGHEERVARIERSLRAAIQIKGRPVVRYSIHERMRHHNVPGVSVAVIEGGEIVWSKGYGVKDVETGEPVTPETLFQAASISKPVAAMAMLRLVQEGQLDLDEDVNQYLRAWRVPAYAFDEPVTLRRLVSHTAGLTVSGFPGYARNAEPPSTAGVLRGDGNTDPVIVDIEPGSRFRYSGGGVTVMQQLLEDVTGLPFPEFMWRTVLQPLGMRSSTYAQPLGRDRWRDAASGHEGDGSKVEGDWHVYPEMAAAGLWTTPTDLALLAIEVQRSLHGESNRLLSPDMTAEMLTPVINGYGLGFGTQTGPNARFGHGGANAGFRALLTAFHNRGSGVSIMTNSDAGDVLYHQLLLAIAAEYGWDGIAQREVEIVELPPARREALVGAYRIPSMDMEFQLTPMDDGLFRLTSQDIPPTTLVPTTADELLDLNDGTEVVIEWSGNRVVRLRAQGIEILPVR